MLSFSHVRGAGHVGACGARVSPSATLLLAIDGPAAAAKVWEQRRRRRNRPRLEKGWEVLDFMGGSKTGGPENHGFRQ
jgi:hypothetical protein